MKTLQIVHKWEWECALSLHRRGNSGPISPAQKAITIASGQWTQVIVPLSALGNPAQIKRINIQAAAGAAQTTFYLDEVQLTP